MNSYLKSKAPYIEVCSILHYDFLIFSGENKGKEKQNQVDYLYAST